MIRHHWAAAAAVLCCAFLATPALADDFVTDQFRMTHHGSDGDNATRAGFFDAVYNSKHDEYLVGFSGDGSPDRIFVQRFSGADPSAKLNDEVPINDTAHPVDTDDFNPVSLVYNPLDDQYLAVWTDTTDNIVWAQRLGADGNPIGDNIQVSQANFGGDIETDPVAFDSVNDRYLVVWKGTATNGQHIFGQLLDSGGSQIGPDDFQISQDNPPTGNAEDATSVGFDPVDARYLVAFKSRLSGTDGYDIRGQLLSPSGEEIGANDFRISDMGPDGSSAFNANGPSIAWNSTSDEFLVGWQGDDNTPPQVDNEQEVFVQRLAPDGSELGDNDIRISDMGPDGNANFDAFRPSIVWNPNANEYLVTWHGDDTVNDHLEIYGQRLAPDASQTGNNDFQISTTGNGTALDYLAQRPATLYRTASCDYLATWNVGDIFNTTTTGGEWEIWGRRISASACPPPPPAPTPTPAPGPGPTPPVTPSLKPGACANLKNGTVGPDVLTGTTLGDLINGLAGNDTISGGLGDDCLNGGAGKDRLSGDDGNDRLNGGTGNDGLNGGIGNDRLSGGAGNDRLVGGSGKDRLDGGKGKDRLDGGTANDLLNGGPGPDNIIGGSGKDTITGGSGNDIINSADGKAEKVNCGKGKDKVRADKKDKLRGCEVVRAS